MTRGFASTAAATLAVVAGLMAAEVPARPAAPLAPTRLPARLTDTGLYAGGGTTAIDPRNRTFSPQYPLWSDGLEKQRWVYLPAGRTIDATDPDRWDLPVGTKLWKEFSRDGIRVETRVLWKVARERWLFGSYAWNDAGTEATLAPAEGVPGVAEVAAGRYHSIPSRSDCSACHGEGAQAGPLGFTALQLSTDRDPNAIHGRPLRDDDLTLGTLVSSRRLRFARATSIDLAPRIRTSNATTRAVLGYMVGNCAHCHNGRGEIAALGPVIRVGDLLADGDAVARSLVGQRTRWQVPGVPAGESVLVHPGAPEDSAVLVRLRSRAPSSQMPPLGTVVRDEEAVAAITRWVRAMRPATER